MSFLGLCIPTYKRPGELRTLIQSIGTDVRIYVSDNGATLTEEFRNEFPHVQFRPVPAPAVPMFQNWNIAARMAETEWVIIPSDDDIYYPDSIEVISRSLRESSGAGMVVFGHHFVDDHYKVISSWCPARRSMKAPLGFSEFKAGVSARMPSIALRRSLLQELGYLDEQFQYTASDSDLIQRASLRADVAFVDHIVSGYRIWSGGATRSTLASEGWLRDIDRWGEKLENSLEHIPEYAGARKAIRDEIYAANLLAGLRMLHGDRNWSASAALVRFRKFPSRARLQTQLRIAYHYARAAALAGRASK